MFLHSLRALFILAFAAIIFVPALIIGAIGARNLHVIRDEQRVYTSTTCFVSQISDEQLSYDCNCDGCHPSTCYAEHFSVRYLIFNATFVSSMIHIDEIPTRLQVKVNNSYTCFYDRTNVQKVQWLRPNERPAITLLVVGFSIAGVITIGVVISQIWIDREMADSLKDIQGQFRSNVQTQENFSSLPVVYVKSHITEQRIIWPQQPGAQTVANETPSIQPTDSSLQNGEPELFQTAQITSDHPSVGVQRANVQNGNLSENDAPPANRSKRPASKCTNGHQSKKRRATVPHAPTPTHEMAIGLLFPLESKIDKRNERPSKLIDCFGWVPRLILYGNSLPSEIDVELASISKKREGVYYYSVYPFVEYQENPVLKKFVSKIRRRVAVEMLCDGIGIIRLDNISVQNQRSEILGKPNNKKFPLKSYPSDKEKYIRAKGPTAFVKRYNLAKPCLAIRLFPTGSSVPIKINTSEEDRYTFFSNILTPGNYRPPYFLNDLQGLSIVPNLSQPRLDDRSKIEVKYCNSSAFIGSDGQNRFNINFVITFPEEMLDELKSNGKWLEISLPDDQELHHSYFIQTEDGGSNSVCLYIQHTIISLTVTILECKLPAPEEVISTESADVVSTDLVLAHLASVPIRTTNEVMPTTPLKVRFQLVHTKPDANGLRKIIRCPDMPIWENIINIEHTAYCDISNNQSDASNAILSEQPVIPSSDDCNEQ
ncbi:unnamed protein product [Adineta ricciae]|uniref:Uncharacterized protein n=1 Tax=Adineta ricciae TaxID=249248 RepID=A0A813RTA6_ADIRI|nr:unnamed protein product [Adineta ricciae]